MFCPNCGTQQPDGTKFCVNCGASLSGTTPAQPQAPAPSPAQPQSSYQPTQQYVAPAPQAQPSVMAQPNQPKKGGTIAIVAAIAVAAVVAVVLVFSQMGKGGQDSSSSNDQPTTTTQPTDPEPSDSSDEPTESGKTLEEVLKETGEYDEVQSELQAEADEIVAQDTSGLLLDASMSVDGNEITALYQYDITSEEAQSSGAATTVQNELEGQDATDMFTSYARQIEQETGMSGVIVTVGYISSDGELIASCSYNSK